METSYSVIALCMEVDKFFAAFRFHQWHAATLWEDAREELNRSVREGII